MNMKHIAGCKDTFYVRLIVLIHDCSFTAAIQCDARPDRKFIFGNQSY